MPPKAVSEYTREGLPRRKRGIPSPWLALVLPPEGLNRYQHC